VVGGDREREVAGRGDPAFGDREGRRERIAVLAGKKHHADDRRNHRDQPLHSSVHTNSGAKRMMRLTEVAHRVDEELAVLKPVDSAVFYPLFGDLV
jgi:hypothetical protein